MNQSFSDTAIIACGTMSLELNALKQEGFLDTQHLLYTTPGFQCKVITYLWIGLSHY
jgi:hypothetical protein